MVCDLDLLFREGSGCLREREIEDLVEVVLNVIGYYHFFCSKPSSRGRAGSGLTEPRLQGRRSDIDCLNGYGSIAIVPRRLASK